jgi:inward rectifier potassium channel
MSINQTINNKVKQDNETGLGTNSKLGGGRFFNKNGSPNMQFKGIPFLAKSNVYHTLLSMSRIKFGAFILSFFIVINLFFACIYLLIGIDHLGGMVATTDGEKFGEAFFFSAQTFTTVGYGRINPIGFWASVAAALEALTGLLSFALATGLLYGRFAKPKAYIKYSDNAIIAPFKDGLALMYRMVPYTKNYLVNVEVKITLAMKILEDNVVKNKFYNLELEVSKANTLTSNWTVVHPINEQSPIFNFSKSDFETSSVEMLVFVQGFDESFANTVVSRTSYTANEFIFGAKFLPMYAPSENGTTTIVNISKLNSFELVSISM